MCEIIQEINIGNMCNILIYVICIGNMCNILIYVYVICVGLENNCFIVTYGNNNL